MFQDNLKRTNPVRKKSKKNQKQKKRMILEMMKGRRYNIFLNRIVETENEYEQNPVVLPLYLCFKISPLVICPQHHRKHSFGERQALVIKPLKLKLSLLRGPIKNYVRKCVFMHLV